MMLRKIATGVALSTALLVPLTACGTAKSEAKSPAKAPAEAAKPKPADALAAAASKARGVSLKLTIGDGTSTAAGSYDKANKIASLRLEDEGETMDMVVTDDEIYLTRKEFQGKVVRMYLDHLEAGHGVSVAADPFGALTLLSGVTVVESAGANAYNGTIDLRQVSIKATRGRIKFLQAVTQAAGARGNAVQFTAKTNADGYLTEFNAVLPGFDDGKDATYNVTLSDFGLAVDLKKPTDNVVDATADMYKK